MEYYESPEFEECWEKRVFDYCRGLEAEVCAYAWSSSSLPVLCLYSPFASFCYPGYEINLRSFLYAFWVWGRAERSLCDLNLPAEVKLSELIWRDRPPNYFSAALSLSVCSPFCSSLLSVTSFNSKPEVSKFLGAPVPAGVTTKFCLK